MRHDVSSEHVLRDDERLVLDDDVLDATDELAVGGEAADVLRLGVASDPEGMVGVGRADPRHADAGLGEDVVHGEGDHVLGLHGWKEGETGSASMRQRSRMRSKLSFLICACLSDCKK